MTWIKGQSGRPVGRPKGARQKLTESFLKAMIVHFNKNKNELIPAAIKQDPSGYLKTIASILPKNVKIDPSEGGALFQIFVESKPREAIESGVVPDIDIHPTAVLAELIEEDTEDESLVESDT